MLDNGTPLEEVKTSFLQKLELLNKRTRADKVELGTIREEPKPRSRGILHLNSSSGRVKPPK